MATITVDACRYVHSSTAEERVKRGARWLDENFPGWEGRIHPDTLDVSSGVDCICGQVFAEEVQPLQERGVASVGTGFDVAYMTLFTEANSWISAMAGPALPVGEAQLAGQIPWTDEQLDRRELVATGLGFYAETGRYRTVSGAFEDDVDYEDLTEAWKALLARRSLVGVS